MTLTPVTQPVLQIAKNRTVQIVLVAVVVLGFVYIIGRSAGRSQNIGPTVDYPTRGNGLPSGWDKEAETLLQDLYNVISGWLVLSGTKDDVFQRYLDLSDDQLTYLYNLWSSRYFYKDQETLTEAIDNEKWYDTLSGKKPKLVNRLIGLKLR